MARDVDPAARGGEWNGQPVHLRVRRQGHLVHPRRLVAPGEILACSGEVRRIVHLPPPSGRGRIHAPRVACGHRHGRDTVRVQEEIRPVAASPPQRCCLGLDRTWRFAQDPLCNDTAGWSVSS